MNSMWQSRAKKIVDSIKLLGSFHGTLSDSHDAIKRDLGRLRLVDRAWCDFEPAKGASILFRVEHNHD